MKRSWIYAALGFFIAALLTLLLFLGRVPVERYAAISADLIELRETNALLTRRVLETRLGLSWNYDGIVEASARLRELMQRFERHRTQVGNPTEVQEEDAPWTLAQLVQHKRSLVEDFKSKNAVLRFNLRYLPQAAQELVDAIERDPVLEWPLRRDLVAIVERTTKEALQLLAENGQVPPSLASHLEQLRTAADSVQSLLSADLDRFVALTTSVMKLKPEVDGLVMEIERVPLGERLGRLYRAFTTQRDMLILAIEHYRWMLYAAALALLAYLTVILVRLRMTSSRLQTALADMHFQKFAMDQHAIVVVLNPDGVITYANDKFCAGVGLPREALLGHSYHAFWPRDDTATFDQMWDTVRAGRVWHGEICHKRADGGLLWLNATCVPFVDASGSPPRYVAICTDISARKMAEEQLRYQARHDSLTGLLNRREFERRLGATLSDAQRRRVRHAMLYVDLDQFKLINDTCGHVAGDEVLRQLGAELGRATPTTDVVARLGGDEFGILLHDCQAIGALERARAIHKVIGEFRFVWEDQVFQLSASIGVAPITTNTPDLATVLATADLACSLAKEKGRNRIHFYEPDDRELQQRHNEMQWVSRIKQALETGRLVLFAQRIEPLGTGAAQERYEVLLRMRDEDGNPVAPGAFIPAAERYGLMPDLDRWVIAATIDHLGRQAVRRKGGTAGPILSINISGTSLGRDDLLEYIHRCLHVAAVDPAQLCFEITETAAISNLKEAGAFLRAVRELGCQVALDDFGSGLSSFTYLKRLPVDLLKIDGSFVRDMCHEPLSGAMVRAVTEIARTLDVRTIAEFVETEETLIGLREIGVDHAQGFLIHTPAPIEQVIGNGAPGDASGGVSFLLPRTFRARP